MKTILWKISSVLAAVFMMLGISACDKAEAKIPEKNEEESVVVDEPEDGGEEGEGEGEGEQVKSFPKKLGIMGDSISSFEGIIPSDHRAYYPAGDVDSWEKTYWGVLAKQYWNCELDVNTSWSGSSVADGKAGSVRTPFVERVKLFKEPDTIILFGGTNDAIASNEIGLGEFSYDVELDKMNTTKRFRDAYIYVIRSLQANYPKTRIICIIGTDISGEYGNSVQEIAKHYELPYVDFRGDSKVSIYKGSHPDAAGHAYKAKKIYRETFSLFSDDPLPEDDPEPEPEPDPAGTDSLSINIGEYAAEKGWTTDGSVSCKIEIDGITMTASDNGGYPNGVCWIGNDTTPTDWRFYQARGGGMTITVPDGYELVSVTFTYKNKNSGILVAPDGSQVPSDTACALSGQSAMFTVGNTGSLTNGQARISQILLKYKATANS